MITAEEARNIAASTVDKAILDLLSQGIQTQAEKGECSYVVSAGGGNTNLIIHYLHQLGYECKAFGNILYISW